MKANMLTIFTILCFSMGCTEMHPYRFIDAGATPLHLAAANGDIGYIKSSISQGADVDLRVDSTDATLLHFAAWKGQHDTVKLLIDLGADVNATTDWGASPLHYAAGLYSKECLVAYGSISPGLSAGHTTTVKLLLEHGADVNIRDREGSTALMKSAVCNAADIALLLINHGAELNVRGNQYTALEMAVARGPEVAALLVKHGAELNTRDPYAGATPIHTAINLDDVEMVRLLLKHGADVNLRGRNGGTPLHAAARKGNDILVELLMQYGADTNIKDDQGMTPLDIAVRHIDTTKLLKKHGAKEGQSFE